MAVEFDGGVVIGADSRTTRGYGSLGKFILFIVLGNQNYAVSIR